MESTEYIIKKYSNSEEDFEKLFQLWHTVFPEWPIERQRLGKILHHPLIPGNHYIHEHGFILSYLVDGTHGKISAVGVLPRFRGKGLGTALLKNAQAGLKNAAGEGGLKSLEIGSKTPRFWPGLPIGFSQEVKDFFVHRSMSQSTNIKVLY